MACRRSSVIAAGLLIATVSLTGCTGGGGERTAAPTSAAAAPTSAGAGAAVSGAAAQLQTQYEQVIGQVLPSVVEIRSSTGLGSGIVYDDKGHVVTNAHVVGTDTRFQVLTSGSATPLDATLVGTYPPNDLAVIAVADPAPLKHPATFADSSAVTVGDIVLAMGNPLGLSATVTDGIVSAVGRTVGEPAEDGSPGATLPDMIQTSAAINPGNSGGALVDLTGRVVGIPTLAAQDPQTQGGGAAPGIGFAIPANQVTRVAGQLVDSGTVTHSGRAALGVQVTTITDGSGNPEEVGVVGVQDGGAAQAAGIRAGDVIVEVDGKPTPTTQALSAVLADLDPGRQVSVTVVRDGTRMQVQVTLGELGG